MFLLTATTILSFLFGFAFPPLWILTFLSVRAIVRIGRANHEAQYRAQQEAQMKLYLSWSK